MPHLIYLAIGFPPASKSCAYRMKAMANAFAESGWDVTAVSLADSSWEIDNGTDQSLLAGLNPTIKRVPVNLRREDFEPIIGRWTPLHARNPDRWKTQFLKKSTRDFPEKIFGAWRTPLIEAVSAVYRKKPADLLIVSPAPYTTLAVAEALHRQFSIPYVVDYRDGWSVDVINGGSAFDMGSKQDRIEREVLKNASAAWFVNEPIMEFYKDRYPESSTKFSVVRNGYDASAVAEITPHIPAPSPLSIGYLGTLNLTIPQLKNLLEGWRVARESVPGLREATLEFRGHVGAGYASGAGGHARLISEYEGCGVSYGGAVAKADVATVYSRWNALVLALIGGEYVTSGKVYEYMATGLPILSVHEANHAACDVLDGYPLWALAEPSSPESVATGFTSISQIAAGYDEVSRRKALDHANSFEYKSSMSSVVDHASALARPPAEF
ncbi:MAG: glycosyltransferase, partial [Actinomycetes bacterium]